MKDDDGYTDFLDAVDSEIWAAGGFGYYAYEFDYYSAYMNDEQPADVARKVMKEAA